MSSQMALQMVVLMVHCWATKNQNSSTKESMFQGLSRDFYQDVMIGLHFSPCVYLGGPKSLYLLMTHQLIIVIVL